jgi:hypothetical protein
VQQQRAVRAASFAVRHEELAASSLSPQMTDFHVAMAAAQRRTEERHLVAARIQQDHAQRLERWTRGDAGGRRPGLITAVASTAGSQSAALTLLGRNDAEGLVAASDATSLAAHDLELTVAEGPSRDAMKDPAPLRAAGSGLSARWPHYGPALRELGVHAVAAVGLRTFDTCLGSLTVFEPHTTSSGPAVSELTGIAEAVLHNVLLDPDALDSAEGLPTLTQFERDDFQPVLHQAAGSIHARRGCGIETALALIRAHAFAEGLPAAAVAHDVVRGVLTLP